MDQKINKKINIFKWIIKKKDIFTISNVEQILTENIEVFSIKQWKSIYKKIFFKDNILNQKITEVIGNIILLKELELRIEKNQDILKKLSGGNKTIDKIVLKNISQKLIVKMKHLSSFKDIDINKSNTNLHQEYIQEIKNRISLIKKSISVSVLRSMEISIHSDSESYGLDDYYYYYIYITNKVKEKLMELNFIIQTYLNLYEIMKNQSNEIDMTEFFNT